MRYVPSLRTIVHGLIAIVYIQLWVCGSVSLIQSGWRNLKGMLNKYIFLCSLGAQQAEDPRLQWRKKRETMLSDYLTVAQSDLLVRLKFYPFETL